MSDDEWIERMGSAARARREAGQRLRDEQYQREFEAERARLLAEAQAAQPEPPGGCHECWEPTVIWLKYGHLPEVWVHRVPTWWPADADFRFELRCQHHCHGVEDVHVAGGYPIALASGGSVGVTE